MKTISLILFFCFASRILLAQVGDWPVNPVYTYFGTPALNQNANGNYALLQDKSVGITYLNSPLEIHFRINNNERMVLTNSGNFEIGGGHVYVGPFSGSTEGTGRLSLSGDNAELNLVNRSATSFVESPTQGERWSIYNAGSATDGKLRFWSNGDVMVLTKEGRVGIGTTSPDQLLTVNGTIHSKEVKVDLSVPAPDYVFEKAYKLTSLDSIKTYIDQHKHLPEVPSAKEMEGNGVNLGEMNMLLLKKVEEMTLYMIELKKENQRQQTEIDKLIKKG